MDKKENANKKFLALQSQEIRYVFVHINCTTLENKAIKGKGEERTL
jgi:hypothetical protein